MIITFRKTSNSRHELVVQRDDGSTDRMDCETRSVLDHDLIHLAVEREAGLEDGFWGSLAGGMRLDELNDREREFSPDDDALMFAEKLVAVMTGVTRSDDPESAVGQARDYLEQVGVDVPDYLTGEFVRRVVERLRQLRGHWRATAFGAEMQIDWSEPSHVKRSA